MLQSNSMVLKSWSH